MDMILVYCIFQKRFKRKMDGKYLALYISEVTAMQLPS